MQRSHFILPFLTAAISLAGCQSAPSAAPPATQSQAEAPAPPVSAPMAKPQPLAQPAPRPVKAKPRSTQDIAQLDLDTEGGVRDGSYVMWVHVTAGSKAVTNVPVLAFNSSNKLAAAARTNEDGDAVLKVQATTYRISATRGRWHAEQTVIYHPGNQFELAMRR